MTTASEYRRYADLCDKLVGDASDAQEKRIVEHIAVQWRRLANLKDRQLRRARGADDGAAK